MVWKIIVLTAILMAATSAQPRFRVGGLALDSPPQLIGHCNPTRVHFNGRINATGPGEVTYEWIRSDHSSAPVRTIRFDRPGPRTITYDWSIRGRASGWVAFRILSPNRVESNKVPFRVDCGR